MLRLLALLRLRGGCGCAGGGGCMSGSARVGDRQLGMLHGWAAGKRGLLDAAIRAWAGQLTDTAPPLHLVSFHHAVRTSLCTPLSLRRQL